MADAAEPEVVLAAVREGAAHVQLTRFLLIPMEPLLSMHRFTLALPARHMAAPRLEVGAAMQGVGSLLLLNSFGAEQACDGITPTIEEQIPVMGGFCFLSNIGTSSNVSEESPNALLRNVDNLKSPITASTTPPKVRSSVEKLEYPVADPSLLSHKKAVSLVASALHPSPLPETSDPMVSDSDGIESEEEGSGEEDSEMSEYDDPEEFAEPDDAMTLVQYQSGLRKEALARKGLQSSEASHKKGRLEAEKLVVQ